MRQPAGRGPVFRSPLRRDPDRGMVILETALGLGILLAVSLLLLGAAKIGIGEVGAVSAARDAALAAARGETVPNVIAGAQRQLPGANVVVRRTGRSVEVVVSAPMALLPGLGSLGPRHQASAVAPMEPGLP